MPISGYFSTERDRQIIKAGGFFCEACLVEKPFDDQSPDPRYCLGCYEFLLKDAEMLDPRERPKWLPKPKSSPKIEGQKVKSVAQDRGLPLVALKSDSSANGGYQGKLWDESPSYKKGDKC